MKTKKDELFKDPSFSSNEKTFSILILLFEIEILFQSTIFLQEKRFINDC